MDLQKARTWWLEAESAGADVSQLLPVLSDRYDLVP
jgi:hypothetical protein